VFVVAGWWLCRRVICSRVAGFKLQFSGFKLQFSGFKLQFSGVSPASLNFCALGLTMCSMKLQRLVKGSHPGRLAVWEIARPTPFLILDPNAEKLRLMAASLAAAGWSAYLKTVEPIPFNGLLCLRYEIPAGDTYAEPFSADYWRIARGLMSSDPARVHRRAIWAKAARKRRA
jgi:hypothetical protein